MFLPQHILSELSEMFRLACPLVLTQLAWVAMLATDTAMIGHLGSKELAGATLSLMVYFIIYVSCVGLTASTASLAAQHYGAGKKNMVRRVIRQGLWVAFFLTFPCVAALSFLEWFLVLIGQPAAALPHANSYMSTLKWSLPFAVAFTVLRNFVSALNRPMVAFWIMLTGVFLNALLDYALIFGKFGLPRLELIGAGISTTSVNVFMLGFLLVLTVRLKPYRNYRILSRFFRPDWLVFKRIFRIGLPIAAMSLMEAGFFIAVAFVMGLFGVTALAAHMIAIQLPHISYMVPMGLGQAATVLVGQAVGRQDIVTAYRIGWMVSAVALIFMSAATVLILIIPETFVSIFIDQSLTFNVPVMELAVSFLLFAAFFQLADGIQAVIAGALRGLNDTFRPMLIAALSYWVFGLGLGVILAFKTELGATGLWIGFVAGLSAAALLLTVRFLYLQKKCYMPMVLSSNYE